MKKKLIQEQPKIVTSDLPFGEYLENWLVNVRYPRLRETTIQRYDIDMRRVQSYPISKVPMSQLDDQMLQQLYNTVYKDNNSANIVKCMHKVIKPCIQYAAIRGDIRVNFIPLLQLPKDNQEIQLKKQQRKKERPFTIEDEITFVNSIRPLAGLTESGYEVMWLTALRLGCRVSELVALTWEDVDFENRLMDINKKYSVVKDIATGQYHGIVGPPKSDKGNRILPIPIQVVAALRKHKVTQAKCLLEIGIRQTEQNLVFGTNVGTYRNYSNIDKYLVKHCAQIGIHRHTMHDFRHTFCTRAYEAGLSDKTIQDLMGDADLKMLMGTYVHVSNSKRKATIKELDEYYDMLHHPVSNSSDTNIHQLVSADFIKKTSDSKGDATSRVEMIMNKYYDIMH